MSKVCKCNLPFMCDASKRKKEKEKKQADYNRDDKVIVNTISLSLAIYGTCFARATYHFEF